MMIKNSRYFFCLFLIFFLTSTQAFATGIYYGLFTGNAVFKEKQELRQKKHSKKQTGYTLGTVLGCDLGIIGFEGEFSYQKASLNQNSQKGSIRTRYYMFNGFLYSPLSCIVTPYLGIGIGSKDLRIKAFDWFNESSASASSYSYSYSSSFPLKKQIKASHCAAWQAIFGVKCPILCQMEAALEVRLKDTFKKTNSRNYHSTIFLKYFF